MNELGRLGRRAYVASPTTQMNMLRTKKKKSREMKRTRAKVISLHQGNAKASTGSVDCDPGSRRPASDDQYVKHVFVFLPGHAPCCPAPLEGIQHRLPRWRRPNRRRPPRFPGRRRVRRSRVKIVVPSTCETERGGCHECEGASGEQESANRRHRSGRDSRWLCDRTRILWR